MGLCKCPKRRVTNQFCFEHRVNVCEHCMVSNHPKCIVQSYLQWLQDSDYNPICELCTKDLACDDCVRLICYHVYHWTCIDKHARQLPATTAPAGYTCPSCKVGLFPAGNLVSPVADVLKEKLAGVNWARAGLGLPLLTEDREHKPSGEVRQLVTNGNEDSLPSTKSHLDEQHFTSAAISSNLANQRQGTPKRLSVPNMPAFTQNHSNTTPVARDGTPHSVVHVEDNPSAFSRSENFPTAGQAPRRIFQAIDDSKNITFDHDENKYKRRSALEWFSRWWKSISGPPIRGRSSGGHLYRRFWMAAILFLIALCTMIIVFSWLGRMSTEDDPSFDPHQNPNIHIGQQVDQLN